jgi:LysM repeat protein
LLVVLVDGKAEKKSQAYEKYIKTYGDLAVYHQKAYGIPASITLAQGILESAGGQSDLARNANNHFGIKCHTGWQGGKTYRDDDLKNECFRTYKKVEDSFEDHSLFLSQRPYYTSLFKLSVTDYAKWAKGLQQAGYATDRAYANRLIKLIEDYELYHYDTNWAPSPLQAEVQTVEAPPSKVEKVEKQVIKKEKTSAPKPTTPSPQTQQAATFAPRRPIHDAGGLMCVYATSRDNPDIIAKETGLTPKEILEFNEIPKDFPLHNGDPIYLEKKRKKAIAPNYDHVVQIGESMHSISQKYGVQLPSLYKMNKKDESYTPVEGDVLKLR